MKTFSIGFEEASFDELDRARLVAERYGTDHHELVLRPDAVELLPKLVEAFDEPFGDSSALPTYLVSELAAGEVKVALSGEGGDELFGGYYTYVADLLAPRVGRLAALAAPLVERAAQLRRARSASTTKRSASRAAPACRRWSATTPGRRSSRAACAAALLGGRDPGWDPVDLYRERYAETAGAEPLARLQDVDLGIYLVDDLLVKTDRSSMAHSLELRVPFLDQRGRRVRARAADARSRCAASPRSACCARRWRRCCREEIVHGPQAGLLDPGRRLAARRRCEPFARDVLSRRRRSTRQGCLDPATVDAACSTRTAPAARTSAASSGA